ncbi:hypothetical protein GDO81_004583 [Engystomops pustulosus]|uniref:Uncharacterized protein n=1 Tax=Engystomops pustulosus TaxID=76066 RepID=A0AAV6ZTA3_ENGPU|nr:hypothetical protein GDO81_004583 [Engystomops pustulosus]
MSLNKLTRTRGSPFMLYSKLELVPRPAAANQTSAAEIIQSRIACGMWRRPPGTILLPPTLLTLRFRQISPLSPLCTHPMGRVIEMHTAGRFGLPFSGPVTVGPSILLFCSLFREICILCFIFFSLLGIK